MLYLCINYVAIQLRKDTLPNPASIYLFKVNNRNTRKRPDVCSKLTMKIPEWRYLVVLVSSLLTLNYSKPFPSFPIVDFEQVNICWESYLTFYSCDICFNVSTGGRLDLTRSNAGNSVIFLIPYTQWDVIFANLRLLK